MSKKLMWCRKRTREEDFLELARDIKSGRIDVNEPDPLGRTNLSEAVADNHFALTSYLLQNGANINHRDIYGMSILYYAKTVEMVEFLIERGANVKLSDEYDMNLLHHAIYKRKDINIVRYFIGSGGLDINDVDMFNKTALHYAARCGENSAMIFKLLVYYGANIECVDSNGASPIKYIQDGPYLQTGPFVEYMSELAAQFNSYYSCFVEGKFEEFFKADGLIRYNIYKRHYSDLPLIKRFCDFINQKFDKNGVCHDDCEFKFKIDHPSLNLPVDIIKREVNSVSPGYGHQFVKDMHNHIWNKNVVNGKFIYNSESKAEVFNHPDLTSLIMGFVGPCEEIEYVDSVTEGLLLSGEIINLSGMM